MIRYARAPSKELLAMFDSGGLLECLRAPQHVPVSGVSVRLDLQFREGDEIALYCGQTRALTLRRVGRDLDVTAHDTYRKQPCAAPLMRRWLGDGSALNTPSEFVSALTAYLASVEVGARWVQREGAVQSRWGGGDVNAVGLAPWIALDRESVLGYGSADARNAVLTHPALEAALVSLEALATKQGWGAPKRRSEANELDQLGISEDGSAIVLVELKPADGSDAYYAPFQLMRYVAEWSSALADAANRTSIVNSLDALLQAKARIGLVQNAPTVAPTATLRPVLAFNDRPSAEVRRRIDVVITELRRMLRPTLPLVDSIEVWAWQDGELAALMPIP